MYEHSQWHCRLQLSETGFHMFSENPCEQRSCPKYKVCMINVQGLPICTCPSTFVCKSHGKNRKGIPSKVCGNDGLTYDSRCHLRIASCTSIRRIKRLHDGECTGAEKAENRIDNNNNFGGNVQKSDMNELDFGRGIEKEDADYLATVNKAKRRRQRQKKKKDKRKRRQRKRERKERSKKKGSRRQKRMKRRNDGYNMYSKRYGYLIGKHTKWSRSQIRKSKI